MNKLPFLTIGLWLCLLFPLSAQTLYVDATRGKDEAKGTITDPVASLDKAVALAHDFTGNEPVTIKIYPGLYVLRQLLEIKTRSSSADTVRYSLEAVTMPDDPDWQPTKMPVIQSISADNSTKQFAHAVGFLVARNNVSFKGLKFLGNSNPTVRYYYPITREDETLQRLNISQCYFIGEKNSSPIQGAIWAHGGGTHVDHTIFYGCKNALLLFKSITNFALTNSIISGSYEAAVWFGDNKPDFVFRNNIVTNCAYFWLRPENTTPGYTFATSVITGNAHYMGFFGSKGAVEASETNQIEHGVRKSGTILLSEVKTNGLPTDYLNLLPQSDGYDLKAGIFKTPKQ
ncbi:hypothetical protein GO755_12590 [Spirosoma sp. HMF4905]|uniref:Right-handed parallel beta-helix repeat-containing protein n=1 Tax=Spirosoma arboris TaxID=2682092 RepID=A0A7K1SAL8_9BACT|nr:hypothetical protein [Spirosoma arboris]MVM30872.1 hypothetical protein [Spirosoma arboris]